MVIKNDVLNVGILIHDAWLMIGTILCTAILDFIDCDGDSNFAQSNPPHVILQLSFFDPSVPRQLPDQHVLLTFLVWLHLLRAGFRMARYVGLWFKSSVSGPSASHSTMGPLK